jgi:hypothetical protein
MAKKTTQDATPKESKKPLSIQERRAEARKQAEQLCAMIGASHSFLSELLIEATNYISAETAKIDSSLYAQNHGALAARVATPLEIAGSILLEKHKKNTSAGKIFNSQRLKFLSEVVGSNSAAAFMTQNASKDYLNTVFEGKSVVMNSENVVLIVDAKKECDCPMCQSRRNGTSIEDALKEALEGFQVVVSGPFDDPFGNPFGDGRENGRAFNPSDFFRDMRG